MAVAEAEVDLGAAVEEWEAAVEANGPMAAAVVSAAAAMVVVAAAVETTTMEAVVATEVAAAVEADLEVIQTKYLHTSDLMFLCKQVNKAMLGATKAAAEEEETGETKEVEWVTREAAEEAGIKVAEEEEAIMEAAAKEVNVLLLNGH